MSRDFERHVFAVQRYVALTNSRYLRLIDPSLVGHPICCFGNVEQAQVVTVGVNPSKGEFVPRDRWPNSIGHNELARRCREYFNQTDPHPWFEPWNQALGHLRHSYVDGTAVHLDLSPRPTRFMYELQDASEQELFRDMIERDLWTFFGTLALCPKVKLILMAGTVTGSFYINEFFQRFAPAYGFELMGLFNRLSCPGNGKTAFHALSGGGRDLGVFFCSISPSARDKKEVLPQRVEEHAEKLRQFLAE